MDLLLAVHFLLVHPMAWLAREDLVALIAIATLLQIRYEQSNQSSGHHIAVLASCHSCVIL